MFSSKKHFKGLLTTSVVFTLIMLLSIWSPSIPPFQSSICPSPSYKAIKTTSGDELEMALSGASMANKTLIIAILNKAYIEGEKPMLDIFLESFWLGEKTQFLVDHLLLVAMDQTAFDRCKFLRLHCYRLVTEGVDFGGEKLYMSRDFINMMWRRTIFLAEVLQRGYSFIFTDIDIMWLRNPFLHLHQNETDMQISCDKFGTSRWCRYNLINTGFYFVKSNNKTIALYNKWYASRNETKYKGMKEQDVLKSMIRGGQFRAMGLTVSYLDTVYFSGFCEKSKRFGLVATVHANCCRTINAKVVDLTAVLRDWKDLKTMVASRKRARGVNNETRVIGWSLHTACLNSWNGFREQIL
ncbi:hypothetical protein ACHQM5_007393 [Ranunculus cassubicifolius]